MCVGGGVVVGDYDATSPLCGIFNRSWQVQRAEMGNGLMSRPQEKGWNNSFKVPRQQLN